MGTIVIEDDGAAPGADETSEQVSAIEDLTDAVETLEETLSEALETPAPESVPDGEVSILLSLQQQIDALQTQINELATRVNATEVEAIQETFEAAEIEAAETEIDTAIVVEPVGEIIEPTREPWHIDLLRRLPRWVW